MQFQQKDENHIYLLANRSYHKKNTSIYSIDNEIFRLFQKKFPELKITIDDYNKNIHKIETLFIESNNEKIIGTTIDHIVTRIENGTILF
tara:strand:- start:3056 stop:3325 length:270 start_codon:yes stop_codon:yes gene_type:complete